MHLNRFGFALETPIFILKCDRDTENSIIVRRIINEYQTQEIGSN